MTSPPHVHAALHADAAIVRTIARIHLLQRVVRHESRVALAVPLLRACSAVAGAAVGRHPADRARAGRKQGRHARPRHVAWPRSKRASARRPSASTRAAARSASGRPSTAGSIPLHRVLREEQGDRRRRQQGRRRRSRPEARRSADRPNAMTDACNALPRGVGTPVRGPDRLAARRHRLGRPPGRSRGNLHRAGRGDHALPAA